MWFFSYIKRAKRSHRKQVFTLSERKRKKREKNTQQQHPFLVKWTFRFVLFLLQHLLPFALFFFFFSLFFFFMLFYYFIRTLPSLGRLNYGGKNLAHEDNSCLYKETSTFRSFHLHLPLYEMWKQMKFKSKKRDFFSLLFPLDKERHLNLLP